VCSSDLLPFIIFIFAFSYVPLFGWLYAFFNFKPGIPLSHSHFEGLKYFKLMLNDRYDLTRVLTNTLALSFLGILCSVFPVTLAIMITEVKSKFFKKLIQTTTTLPNFISWVIIFSIAFTIFSSDGLMNQILLKTGLAKESVNILGNVNIVWIFQTLLGLWKGLGWGSIIYIAAITGIDGELYDAAKVDGAGRFRCIRHITLPGISSTYFVLLLLSISGMLSVGFEQYFVFYNSMVADKIEVLDYYVYKLGLVTHDYSYSTAVGILKTVVSLILLFSVNKLSKKIRGNSII
jgi:putative aldouronate transport system permease protein